MNTWYSITISNMANHLAEDVGAPELRNPLNSAFHANRHSKSEFHPLRTLIDILSMVFAK